MIDKTAEEIISIIKNNIDSMSLSPNLSKEGTVISVRDGIVDVYGLDSVGLNDVIILPGGVTGIAMDLRRDYVGVSVLGEYQHIKEGDKVIATGETLCAPIGDGLLGRVINPLGLPIDNHTPINCTEKSPIEKIAPGVIDREPVNESLLTGIKSIDCMIPIGKGQRELIAGDRQTGKTAIAIDTIINQKDRNVKCIYVAIGQKNYSIAAMVRKLNEFDAMKHTIIVAANASDPAALQYIAPYVGCTIGEYYRDRGEDALVIYDDLTKHAWAYRQISLLLRRPPGREAYPGDIFYLHSRLLERASRVSARYVEEFTKGAVKNKTGSLTALPIIETQAGDVSAFIPTNVISITDGQIFLEADLFNAGVRPAINSGLSVSRVGGAAQTSIIKKLSGGVRIGLAQYRELAAFSQFSSELDEVTKRQLERGKRVIEILKQKQYHPMTLAEMSASLFAVDRGYVDDVEVSKVGDFEKNLHMYFKNSNLDLYQEINQCDNKTKTDGLLNGLEDLLRNFKSIA